MNKIYFDKGNKGKTLKQIESRNLLRLADVVKAHNENGGSTFDVKTGENLAGKNLYAVSIFPGESAKWNHKNITELELAAFIEYNSHSFKHDSTALGTWYNDSDGFSYLDIVVLTSKAKAIKLGRAHGQIAIFGLKKLDTITL
jgi:hypothetical protein